MIQFCAVNTVLSAFTIIWTRYAGGRTIVGFAMQAVLLLPQLIVTWTTASQSHHRGLALSLFRSQQVSYNVMLPSYMVGKYFVSIEAQREEAELEEIHGKVLSSAARYMQTRLHLAEAHAARAPPV